MRYQMAALDRSLQPCAGPSEGPRPGAARRCRLASWQVHAAEAARRRDHGMRLGQRRFSAGHSGLRAYKARPRKRNAIIHCSYTASSLQRRPLWLTRARAGAGPTWMPHQPRPLGYTRATVAAGAALSGGRACHTGGGPPAAAGVHATCHCAPAEGGRCCWLLGCAQACAGNQRKGRGGDAKHAATAVQQHANGWASTVHRVH
jgi:hypothetical protein